jgi:hypothetical protein
MITVAYKVGQAPSVLVLDGSLESLQGAVGGYIEAVSLSDNLVLICNEEGKLRGLSPNKPLGRDVICGDFLIVASDDEGDFVSLDENGVQFALEFFD